MVQKVSLSFLIVISLFCSYLYAEPAPDSKPEVKEEKVIEINQESSKEGSVAATPAKKEDAAAEDDGQYNIKLRTLEEKINSLKDKIFRAKQRLSVLQETVLSGAITGARSTIVHRNDVGNTFELISAIYYLDEAPVFKKIDDPAGLSEKEIVVFDGSVIPGPHHVSAYLVYKGKGYGLFSYLEGYTFKIKAGYSFNVEEGRLVEVASAPKDKGASVKLENRLFVDFVIKEKTYEEKKDSKGAPQNEKSE